MLKLLGILIRMALFSLVVLVLGNWVRWHGRTLSDQVRTQLSHAEHLDVVENVKGWAKTVVIDSEKGAPKKNKAYPLPAKAPENEKLPASERQKLRALIQELNTSQNRD